MIKQISSLRTIAWPSHDRPELLQRSINSFIEALGSEANSFHYILALSGNSQVIPSILSKKNVTLIDDKFRVKLISKLEEGLVQEGFESGIAKFALDGNRKEGTEGAHRNAINLLTTEKNYLSSDDDIIFDIKKFPEESWQEFSSFPDWESLGELENKAPSLALNDFLLAHEEALQRTAFSSPGIRGHSIFGGPRFIFTFGESSLEKLCENSHFFEEALGSRLLWSEVESSKILPYSPVATYTLGINNQSILPPCFPFGRNLDGVFIYSAKALNPSTETARLKGSVLHRPPEYRGAYSTLDTLEFRINDILWLMWAQWLGQAPKHLSVEDRYYLAGKYFSEIENKSVEEFSEFLTMLISKSLRDRARILENQYIKLKENSKIKKSDWPRLVENEISLCLKMASSNTPILPVEAEGRQELAQEWISNYGKIIKAWPTMRSLAQRFHTEIF